MAQFIEVTLTNDQVILVNVDHIREVNNIEGIIGQCSLVIYFAVPDPKSAMYQVKHTVAEMKKKLGMDRQFSLQ